MRERPQERVSRCDLPPPLIVFTLCEGLLLLAIELEITGGRGEQRRGEADQGEGDRDYRSDTMMRMMSRTKISGRGSPYPISLTTLILPRWACFNKHPWVI